VINPIVSKWSILERLDRQDPAMGVNSSISAFWAVMISPSRGELSLNVLCAEAGDDPNRPPSNTAVVPTTASKNFRRI